MYMYKARTASVVELPLQLYMYMYMQDREYQGLLRTRQSFTGSEPPRCYHQAHRCRLNRHDITETALANTV